MIEVVKGSKKVKISPTKRISELEKGFGLMFRRREKSPALLFEFKKPVKFQLTSLFVFFPFLVLWLDKNNKIIDKKVVNPWKFVVFSSVKSYSKILEIPCSKRYAKIIKLLVGDWKSLKR